MATTEVKKLWAMVGVVLVLVIAVLALAVISGRNGPTAPEPLTLSEPVGPGDWTTPAATSSVSLVEYSDFQCPACANYAPVIKTLLAEFGDQVAFTYRHFPLRSIHQNAQLAAQAAEAAGRQGKFWEMGDLLFTNQADWESLSNPADKFLTYAKELNLNPAQFTRDLESKEIVAEVNRDFETGTQTGISHTPTFFLDGQEIPNVGSYEELVALINNALANASSSPRAN